MDVEVLPDYYFGTRGYLEGVVHFDSISVDHLGKILTAGRYNLTVGIMALHQLLNCFRYSASS
jgi:hypothetical protein